MKFLLRLFAPMLLIVTLSGCVVAPQVAVPMNGSATKGEARVGVVMATLPKVGLSLPGASCLLCIVAANAANSSVYNHVQTLTHEDIPKLANVIAQRLVKSGSKVVVIDEPLNMFDLPDFKDSKADFALKDFSDLQKKYSIDQLVVIEIRSVGIERTYASYFPTSVPRAFLIGSGFMVNLSNHKYEWYLPVRIVRESDGEWDEPPNFPGLTNAYFQVLEASKDELLKSFGE